MYFILTDLNTRINLNDFFLNNYFYFWTSFWYIPISFTLIIVIFFKKNSHLVIVILLLYIIKMIDYWNMNLIFYNFYKNSELINLLLFNSINKYHPILLYITIITQLWITTTIYKLKFVKTKWVLNTTQILILYPKTLNTVCVIFTLFLGSWWALQEGSWGGWWNWDPSEVVGLYIMIIIINILHKKPQNYIFYKYIIFILFIFLIVIYIFTQLNFNLISHNFNIKTSDIQNYLTHYYVLINFVIILSLYYTNYIYTFFKKNTFFFTKISDFFVENIYIILVYIFITIILSITYSFSTLLNNFLWKIFQITSTPIILSYDTIPISVIVICYLIFFKKSIYKIYLLSLLLTININIWLTLIVLISFNLNIVNYIHFIVYMFILVTFLNKYFIYFYTSKITTTNFSFFEINFLDIFSKNFTLNSNFIEMFHSKTINLTVKQSGILVFRENTSPNFNEMLMFVLNNNTTQILLTGRWNQLFFITVNDYQIINFLSIILVFFVYYYYYFFKKKLIIF